MESEGKDFKKFDQVYERGDSDSSSDVFELPNLPRRCMPMVSYFFLKKFTIPYLKKN